MRQAILRFSFLPAVGVGLFPSLLLLALALVPCPAPAAPAPNGPGALSIFARSDKDFLGTAAGTNSRVYFTGAHGQLTELFYPSPDRIQNIDQEFLIVDAAKSMTAAQGEEKLQSSQVVSLVNPRALVWRSETTADNGAWKTVKKIFADPGRSTFVERVTFQALQPGKTVQDFNLYLLNHPGIENGGDNDNSYALTNGARVMLVANRPGSTASALAISLPWKTSTNGVKVSNGFVGQNDGWTDLFGGSQDDTMDWQYDAATGGNVAQTGWVDFGTNAGASVSFDFVIGFGANIQSAMDAAAATLASDLDQMEQTYTGQWNAYCQALNNQNGLADDQYYLAAMTLKSAQDKDNGAMVAGLGTPWGTANHDGRMGYHLVWSRDLFKFASALIGAGDTNSASRAVDFLFNVEMQPNGRFPQNVMDTGSPYWNGTQMDEQAMPIILAWKLHRADLWPKISLTADFLAANGPWTDQERWEEMPGYSPSTIAAEIAGLVCAADFAAQAGDPNRATHYLQLADAWRNNVANWTFTTNGYFGDKCYFVRITTNAAPNVDTDLFFKNGGGVHDDRYIIDGGFLELVRLGDFSPNDWTIQETLPKYDACIGQTIPGKGPAWFRYNYDGYGEDAAGDPFISTGVGRPWPIFTAERGIYEIARTGQPTNGQAYLAALKQFSSPAGFIPEQVWNVSTNVTGWQENTPAGDVPGTATGSMRPLNWAMGEYINLIVAMNAGHNDAPPIVIRRYASDQPQVTVSFNVQAQTTPGQDVYLVGDHPLLGAWNPSSGIKLAYGAYPNWPTTISLPAATPFQYKYVKIDQSGAPTWESGANRVFTTPASGTVPLHDTFRP